MRVIHVLLVMTACGTAGPAGAPPTGSAGLGTTTGETGQAEFYDTAIILPYSAIPAVPPAIEWSGGSFESRFGAAVAAMATGGEASIAIGAPSTHLVEDTSWPHVSVLGEPFDGTIPAKATYLSGGGADPWYTSTWNSLGTEVLLPGDITGDLEPDLVIFDGEEPVTGWPLGAGAFVFSGPVVDRGNARVEDETLSIDWPGPWRGTPCGDLNADGAADLCLATGVALGPVAEGFEPHLSWSAMQPAEEVRLASADLDGNGARELLLWDPRSSALHRLVSYPAGDHDPADLAHATWTAPGPGSATALVAGGDLDGDGLDDAVVGWLGDSGSTTFLITGDTGGPMELEHAMLDVPARAMAMGDFDGDGHTDLAVGAQAMVRVYLGPFPSGELDPDSAVAVWKGHQHPVDAFGDTLAAADIDGDGRDDLVVGAPSHGSDDVSMLRRGRVYLLSAGGL